VKATQERTTITWCSSVLGFSRLQIIWYNKYNKIIQYELFSIIKYKNSGIHREHFNVCTKKEIFYRQIYDTD